MKRLILSVIGFILILVLAMQYFDEREKRIYFESEAAKWRNTAEIEQIVPIVNKKAKDFVKALNKGKHKEMLTGEALVEYNKAMEDDSEWQNSEELDIDTSLQDVEIILSSTESKNDNGTSSQVLYRLLYKGLFDSEETGIVDQRILTLVMKIDWLNDGDETLVNSYEVILLEDNLGDILSSELKGSESDEEDKS